jgi:antigen flippase
MSFARAGMTLGLSTAVRLAVGLAAIKLVVLLTGASGLGQFGVLMSALTVLSAVAGGGVTNGIVTRIAQARPLGQPVGAVLGTAVSIGLAWSLLLALALLAAPERAAAMLLDDPGRAWLMRWLALGQLGMSFAALIGGYLSGRRLIAQFSLLSIVASVIGMAGVAVGAWSHGVDGALLGLIWLNGCSGLVMAAWASITLPRQALRDFVPRWSPPEARRLLKYSMMLTVSALTLPLTQLFLQQLLYSNAGWAGVGYWQAAATYSDTALQFLTVVLATYYLPRLSEANGDGKMLEVMREAFRYALPVLALFAVLSIALAEPLILLLYSEALLPAGPLMPWQVLGAVLKMLSYVIGYLVVAKGSAGLYIAAEILQSATLALAGAALIPRFGAEGASMAYSLTYALYLCACIIGLRRYIAGRVATIQS